MDNHARSGVADLLQLDGSLGEGGGQVLRTALSLSLVTGQPFCIRDIRAGRPKPGLRRQHLTAVRAAARIGGADVEGDELGSQRLTFVPGAIRPGAYEFSIEGAGSTTLVLQTLLPPLLTAADTSTIRLEGGTHNPFAPPCDFLAKTFLPAVRRMGPVVQASLEGYGFYPAGGGRVRVRIEPSGVLEPLSLVERGRVLRVGASAVVAGLPRHIAERELNTLQRMLEISPDDLTSLELDDAPGPGNVVMAEVVCEQITEVFTGFGRRGVPAERVAEEVGREARRYLEAGVPVGTHLADQLLLPLCIAGGGAFRTVELSLHARTNLAVIRHFLDADVRIERQARSAWSVEVGSVPSTSVPST